MSCQPPYDYRPIAAPVAFCSAPVFIEHRSRLFTGGSYFRSIEQGPLLNNISIQSSYIGSDVFRLTVRYYAVLSEAATDTETYDFIQTSAGSPLECDVGGIDTLRFLVNRDSQYIEMYTRGADTEFDIEGEDSICLDTFTETFMSGGSGGPQDGSIIANINTGPERTIIIINSTERADGTPTDPPVERKIQQWDGSEWVTYQNLVPGACPATTLIGVDQAGNFPPVFAQDILDQANFETDVISLSSVASDPDGNVISYSADGLPSGVTIDINTGLISGTVDAGAAVSSPYSVTVTANDGRGGVVTDDFIWTVVIAYELITSFTHPDLTAAWTMDNISGSTLIDESPNGYDSVITGATPVSGIIDQALDFSSTSTYITHTLPTFGTNDFSISLWYNPDTFTLYNHLLTDAVDQDNFAFKIGTTGFNQVPYFFTSPSGTLAYSSSLTGANWYHIVLMRSGTDIYISVNGVTELVGTGFTYDLTTTSFYTGIGGNVPSEASDGQQDQMRIFDRVLTQSEIIELYDEGSVYYNVVIVDDIPVSYWRLGESSSHLAVDEIGTIDGIYHTGDFGKIGKGAVFNGSDSKIDFSFVTGFPTTDVTVSFWAKYTTNTEKSSIIFASPDETPLNRFNIHFTWSDGRIFWDWGDILVGGRLILISDAGWLNVMAHWTFIAESGVGMRIYRNGTLVASNATTSTFAVGTKTISLGYYNNPVTYWNGDIDELGIWNRSLTDPEIAELYNSDNGISHPFGTGTTLLSGLYSYHNFEDNSNDLVGSLNGLDYNILYDGLNMGQTGLILFDSDTAVAFDGTTQYVSTGYKYDFIQQTGIFTIEVWIQLTDYTLNTVQIIAGTEFASAGHGWTIWYENRTGAGSHAIAFLIAKGTEGTYGIVAFSNDEAVTDNLPHHVVVTGSGSAVTMYVDGIQVGDPDSYVGLSSSSSAANAWIAGTSSGAGLKFDGILDEAAIYDYQLSLTQIHDHYIAAGYTISRPYYNAITADAPIAYWRLGESSGIVAIDEIGTYNGTYGGDVSVGQTSLIPTENDQSILFNGSSGAVNGTGVPLGDNPTTFSIEVIVKIIADNTGTSSQFIYDQRDETIGEHSIAFLYRESTGKFAINKSPSTGNEFNSNLSVTLGQIYHLVYIEDGINRYLYINGVLDNSDALAEVYTGVATTGWSIGQLAWSTASGATFNGVIDDMSLYDYALTPAQVINHYDATGYENIIAFNHPNLVAGWTMDNISGSTLVDESPNGNDSIITGATQTSGLIGQALDFSSTSTYITHTLPAFGTNDFAISMWYNPDTFTFYSHLLTATTGQSDFAFKIGDSAFSGKPYFYTLASGSKVYSTGLTAGSWQHIVLMREGTNIYISINGDTELVGTGFTNNLTTTSFYTGIGQGIEHLDGQADQMRVFDRALTQNEIDALYNGGAGA